ncbi:hypothetical protein KBZ10_10045 [Streptomyces sp. F63]|uniref:hypothetical protein n=1 Tax=Streptomyces sp. F63 TaxID=2824887 RepID=UPI001B387E2B|nr:hypothetical protein [Streptomyces sp. F63]MBQ0984849.1 hypothetical protein [Streptomyces sp. F63]
MTAAFDYEDMHHLVDRLTPHQVRRLRLLVTQDEELAQAAEALPPRPHFGVVRPRHAPALTLLP